MVTRSGIRATSGRLFTMAAMVTAGAWMLQGSAARASFVFTPLGTPNVSSEWVTAITETINAPASPPTTHYYSQPTLGNDPDAALAVSFNNLDAGTGTNYYTSVTTTNTLGALTKTIDTTMEFTVNYLAGLPVNPAVTVKERGGAFWDFNSGVSSFSGTVTLLDMSNNVLATSTFGPSGSMDSTVTTDWAATKTLTDGSDLVTGYKVLYQSTITATANPAVGSAYAGIGKDAVYFDIPAAGSGTLPPIPEPASLGLLGLGAMGLLAKRRK